MSRGRGAILFLSSSSLFTISSWRLRKLFCTTTVIPLRFATDNFIPQLRLRWVKSPPVTSASSSSTTRWRRLHSLLVSSVISRGSGGERFMCFEELPLEVSVFGRMIRESIRRSDVGVNEWERNTLWTTEELRKIFVCPPHKLTQVIQKNVIIPVLWLG